MWSVNFTFMGMTASHGNGREAIRYSGRSVPYILNSADVPTGLAEFDGGAFLKGGTAV